MSRVLTESEIIDIANRFTKEMGTKEFIERFVGFVKAKGAMDPDKLLDELENLQKFLFAEWDIHADVTPDDVLDQLHNAAKKYPTDKLHDAMDLMCSRIQWVLDFVGNANGGGQHGHSHNGQPCHGHGDHAHHQQQQHASHGHSHNGQPCHGHHGHGPMGQMHPMQMQMMQLAVGMALDDAERAYMAESQKMVMEGRMAEVDDARKQKMGGIQAKLMGWMQHTAPIVKEQMDMAYETVLSDEERAFAQETQKIAMSGTRPDEARLKRVNELQAKVMAYVQTMMGFLQQSAANVSGGAAATTTTDEKKEK